MTHAAIAAIVCALLALAMVLLTWAGYRIGRWRSSGHGADSGTGTVDGAVFALLGLLIAFTFSGAYGRMDARRKLIVEEANAIGTAYLRLDLLAEPARSRLREAFPAYVQARAAFFSQLVDPDAARAELDRAQTLQTTIWTAAVAATADEPQSARLLLLPALNDMIDITTTRLVASQTHPPLPIFAILFTLALICALLSGHAMAKRVSPSPLHTFGFAVVTATTFYLILDMEYPSSGLIRLDASNKILLDLHRSLAGSNPPS